MSVEGCHGMTLQHSRRGIVAEFLSKRTLKAID